MAEIVAKVIAYTMGSFWLCVPCVDKHYQDVLVLSPAVEGDTFGVYEYSCDHPGCNRLIQAKDEGKE